MMLPIYNPYTRDTIATLNLLSWEAIDEYLSAADTLSRQKPLPTTTRIHILEKSAALMKQRAEELALQIANEGGKPLRDARIEVARAIQGVELCAHDIANIHGTQIPMDLTPAGQNHVAFTTREPIGTVVAVSAFNHPLNLIVHQVAPAIAVGCPILVRPSSETPLSCQSFIHILYEAGLPEEWCRFALCDRHIAEKMVTDSRVRFFSFIGSAKVGWALQRKLAPGVRSALEHGGVAPVIVDTGIPTDTLLAPILKGGFYHSGQVCVSVQRLFLPRDVASSTAHALAKEADRLIVGNAIEESTDCGPLIKPQEVARVEQWVDEAVKEGAQIICGGHALSETTYAPTVLLNPSPSSKVSTHEIFGPVVCVYEYDTLDEAIYQANSLPFAFQASIFTEDVSHAFSLSQELDASTVLINDHTAFRVDWMPFGGRRHSGYGTGGIRHTMHDMTQEKLRVFHVPGVDR